MRIWLQWAWRTTPAAAVLFVTTFLYGQPATNSQTQFELMDACEDARIRLMTNADNLRRKAQEAEVMRTLQDTTNAPTPPPMVSAIYKIE